MARSVWSIWLFGLGLVGIALAAAAPAAAVGQHAVIAQERTVALEPGEALVRLADVTLPAGGAPVTHAHPPGFTYAVAEPHALTLPGGARVLAPGRAAWVAAQEEHTHARAGAAAGRFFFIGIFPAAARGTAPPGISPAGTRDSAAFPVAAGVYDVVLSEARLPAAGDAVTLPAQRGPAGLWLVEGQASLGGQALTPDDAVELPKGERIAVEVELHAKAERLADKLAWCRGAGYAEVLWLVPAAGVEAPLAGVIDRAGATDLMAIERLPAGLLYAG